MRLINAKTFELQEFFTDIPTYAILSHTWGDDEITLQGWKDRDDPRQRKKRGYTKIAGACHQAIKDNIPYVWVDTNCIDKTSSSELSEAINSMFAWYRDSKTCYVFLEDVIVADPRDTPDFMSLPEVRAAFRRSRWFTRGWTLQELIAPTSLVFYSNEWHQLGTKKTERALISDITGIDSDYLRQPKKITYASVARRMSWMSKRKTTRLEDMAYCMLGIFDINMALLYGEGIKAFVRLQEEIIKVSNDQTIFCWQIGTQDMTYLSHDWISILAPHPAAFRDSGQFFAEPGATGSVGGPYSVTNYGLSISVPLFYTTMGVCAILDVGIRTGLRGQLSRVILRLHRVPGATDGHYVRLFTNLLVMEVPAKLMDIRRQIFVDCRNKRSRGSDGLVFTHISAQKLGLDFCDGCVLLLGFNVPVEMNKKPLDAIGMELNCLDSAVGTSSDMNGERCGILLKGRRTGGDFGLFIAGRRHDTQGIQWHVRTTTTDSYFNLPDDPKAMAFYLEKLPEEVFGTWVEGEELTAVASWKYTERGAIVCFLELQEVRIGSPLLSPEIPRFELLSKSTNSNGING